MRRFTISPLETMKTFAADYGCCKCPWLCECNPEEEESWFNS